VSAAGLAAAILKDLDNYTHSQSQEKSKTIILSNEDILCQHNKLDPNSILKAKKISISGMNMLIAHLGISIDVPLTSPTSYCEPCMKILVDEKLAENEHYFDLERLNNMPDSETVEREQYFISKEWFTSNTHFNSRMEKTRAKVC
jgi:hypothetical protein